jgi:hypothetical protein
MPSVPRDESGGWKLHWVDEHGNEASGDDPRIAGALAPAYDRIFSRLLGPDYSLIVDHMTSEEAEALTYVGLRGNTHDEGRLAWDVVGSAIERISTALLREHRETPPAATELTPAQKARARAKHARRIAFEQPEAES